MPDMIRLDGVECRCKVGVPAAERARRQTLLVVGGREVVGRPAAARDDFRLTADYWAIEKLVRAEAESKECALIETLAERLAAAVLKAKTAAAAGAIRVRKTPAGMPQ